MNFGFRIADCEFKNKKSGVRSQNSGDKNLKNVFFYWLLTTGYWILCFSFLTPDTLRFVLRTPTLRAGSRFVLRTPTLGPVPSLRLQIDRRKALSAEHLIFFRYAPCAMLYALSKNPHHQGNSHKCSQ